MQVNRGVRYSTMLHGGLLLIFILGLPHFQKEIIHTPSVIAIDIIPVDDTSNAHQKTPPKVEKPPIKIDLSNKIVSTPPQTPKITDRPAPPVPPIPVKKVESDPLKDILDNVKNERVNADKNAVKDAPAVKQPAPPVTTNAPAIDTPNLAISLSMTEIDKIKNQIQNKWNVPTGAKDAQNLIVRLQVQVSSDGTVISVKHIGDESKYASEYNFRTAVDSAMTAVRRASPLQNLPADRYSSWSEMELVFNPADMAN